MICTKIQGYERVKELFSDLDELKGKEVILKKYGLTQLSRGNKTNIFMAFELTTENKDSFIKAITNTVNKLFITDEKKLDAIKTIIKEFNDKQELSKN